MKYLLFTQAAFALALFACQPPAGDVSLSAAQVGRPGQMWKGQTDAFRRRLLDAYTTPDQARMDLVARLGGKNHASVYMETLFLLLTVRGSMPIYATSVAYTEESDLLMKDRGDCKQITERFLFVARALGFEGRSRWAMNDHLPGHAFADVQKNGERFIVDLNHGVIVEVVSGATTVHLAPPFLPYYAPRDAFEDWWGSTATLEVWIQEVREVRWPAFLAKGIEAVDALPETQE
jgi:hypothetical protein